MAYSQYGKIEATDYNSTLVGATNSTVANRLNTTLGVGSSSKGYGQTPIPLVGTGNVVAPSNWNNLFTNLSAIASHQNTIITAPSSVTMGSRINHLSTLSSDITNTYINSLNAIAQGTTITNNADRTLGWINGVTAVHIITFASGDAARYFFNAGGQITINCSVIGGTTPISALFSNLCAACGTIYISAMNSGTATIASGLYSGITKVGGSGTPVTLLSNNGYYGLSTGDTEVFRQSAAGQTPSGYAGSYISINIRSNGRQGSNGDAGSVITITTLLDEIPDNLQVTGLTRVTCTLRPPSTTFLTASWGTPTISSTISGT